MRLQERLRQTGIPAIIHDESKLERFWFMSEPRAAIHLEVSPPHFLESCRRISEWDETDHALHNAVRCPECHSSRIEFPQLSRKSVMPGLLSIFMALGIMPRKFYCMDCHNTWPVFVKLDRKLDLLGWPLDSKLWHPERARSRRP